MHRMLRTMSLFLALQCSLSSPAWAQPRSRAQDRANLGAAAEADEPAGYREVITQAVSEYQFQNWDEARALFARAHALYPNARTARGLGIVEFERRNYGESIRYLEEALQSSVKPLEPSSRAEMAQLLERAKRYVSRFTLELDPPSAEVRVDGMPVALGPGSTLTLQIGEHVLEVRAEGFVPERRELQVLGGDEPTLAFVLERESALKPGPLASTTSRHDSRSDKSTKTLAKNPWLWSAVGVVVAGAVVGGIFLLRPEPKTQSEPWTTPNTPPGATLQGLVTW